MFENASFFDVKTFKSQPGTRFKLDRPTVFIWQHESTVYKPTYENETVTNLSIASLGGPASRPCFVGLFRGTACAYVRRAVPPVLIYKASFLYLLH